MPHKPHINQKEPLPASEFTYDSLCTRFRRAKSEDTLDIMFTGAMNRIARELSGKERFQAEIAAARALDKCQQDFDRTVQGVEGEANHVLKQISTTHRPFNPNDELQRLLSEL